MRPWLFTFAAAVSLVLCAATVALWARSYRYLDDLDLVLDPRHFWLIRSVDGGFYVQQTWADEPLWQRSRSQFWSADLKRAMHGNLPAPWQFAGFGYGRVAVPPPPAGVTVDAVEYRVYQAPHAFVALTTALLPGLWLRGAARRRTMRRRVASGLCGRCGYDLRGSATSGRCPECGNEKDDGGDIRADFAAQKG